MAGLASQPLSGRIRGPPGPRILPDNKNWSAGEPDRSPPAVDGNNLDQLMERLGEIPWDPHAAMRGRVQRHAAVGLTMNRVRAADEEDRVVHRAQGDSDVPPEEAQRLVVAIWRDRVPATPV